MGAIATNMQDSLVLFVVSNQEIINSEEEIVSEEFEALAGQQATTLCVIVRLKVTVQHVVDVEGILRLFAKRCDALVDFVGYAVFSA